MLPRDFFDAAVRAAGVFVLIWGLWDLVNSALFYTGYFSMPEMTFRYYLLFGWASIFIGLALIRAGGIIVNFAYPEADSTEAKSELETKKGDE